MLSDKVHSANWHKKQYENATFTFLKFSIAWMHINLRNSKLFMIMSFECRMSDYLLKFIRVFFGNLNKFFPFRDHCMLDFRWIQLIVLIQMRFFCPLRSNMCGCKLSKVIPSILHVNNFRPIKGEFDKIEWNQLHHIVTRWKKF